MADEASKPLEAWRETLRALSSVADLFASGKLAHPDDSDILDRLEKAEAAARQVYRDTLNKTGLVRRESPEPASTPQEAKRTPAQIFQASTSNAALRPLAPSLGLVGVGLSSTDLVGIGSIFGSIQPTIGMIGTQYPAVVDEFRRVEVSAFRNTPHAQQAALDFKGTLFASAGGIILAEPFRHEIDTHVGPLLEQLIHYLQHLHR